MKNCIVLNEADVMKLSDVNVEKHEQNADNRANKQPPEIDTSMNVNQSLEGFNTLTSLSLSFQIQY